MRLCLLDGLLSFALLLSSTSLSYCPQVTSGLVHKAIYGLREAPSLWSEERAEALTNSTFASEGESHPVILSQVHESLCLILKQQSLQDQSPTTDAFGLTLRVLPHQVVALSGIYVDDFLIAGLTPIVHSLATFPQNVEDIRSTISFTRC